MVQGTLEKHGILLSTAYINEKNILKKYKAET